MHSSPLRSSALLVPLAPTVEGMPGLKQFIMSEMLRDPTVGSSMIVTCAREAATFTRQAQSPKMRQRLPLKVATTARLWKRFWRLWTTSET